MDNEANPSTHEHMHDHNCDHHHKWHRRGNGAAGGAYGLGLIGALVYNLQHATAFWVGVLGVLKALVWPAIVVYKLLEFLK